MGDISISGIILLVINLAIGVAVGVIGWSLRRLVQQNDDMHRGQDARIDKLAGAIEAEREARHQFHRDLAESLDGKSRTLDSRIWAVNADLKENYPKRHESMRLYGSLMRKIDEHHRELLDEIKDLPCKRAACPSGSGDGT